MPDPIIIPADEAPVVSRRALRHLITRRRNERVAELRDDRWPLAIYCHPDTVRDLLSDGDPAEAMTVDFEGTEFMGIPMNSRYTGEGDIEPGVFEVVWPVDEPAGRATEPSPVPEGDDG